LTGENRGRSSLRNIEHCVNNVRVRMNTNILNIDEGKTVALVLASRSYKTKHTIAGIKIGDIIPSPSAKNIDAVFDAEMST
ncbi:hypothetical protein LSAT2_010447, partial [Lamellibrachia satsuma]